MSYKSLGYFFGCSWGSVSTFDGRFASRYQKRTDLLPFSSHLSHLTYPECDRLKPRRENILLAVWEEDKDETESMRSCDLFWQYNIPPIAWLAAPVFEETLLSWTPLKCFRKIYGEINNPQKINSRQNMASIDYLDCKTQRPTDLTNRKWIRKVVCWPVLQTTYASKTTSYCYCKDDQFSSVTNAWGS